MKKEFKKDPSAAPAEFKAMLRQLWPLTQTHQPEGADVRASEAQRQASARAGLIGEFLAMAGDLKATRANVSHTIAFSSPACDMTADIGRAAFWLSGCAVADGSSPAPSLPLPRARPIDRADADQVALPTAHAERR